MRLVRRERDNSACDYACCISRSCHVERHILLERVSLDAGCFSSR